MRGGRETERERETEGEGKEYEHECVFVIHVLHGYRGSWLGK